MRSTLAVTLSVAVALSAGIGLVHARKARARAVVLAVDQDWVPAAVVASARADRMPAGPRGLPPDYDLGAWRRETKSQGRSGWWRDRFRSKVRVEDGMEWRGYVAAPAAPGTAPVGTKRWLRLSRQGFLSGGNRTGWGVDGLVPPSWPTTLPTTIPTTTTPTTTSTTTQTTTTTK